MCATLALKWYPQDLIGRAKLFDISAASQYQGCKFQPAHFPFGPQKVAFYRGQVVIWPRVLITILGSWKSPFNTPLRTPYLPTPRSTHTSSRNTDLFWVKKKPGRKGCIHIISHHPDCQVGGVWYSYWHMWDRWKVLLPHRGDRFWWCNQLQNNKEY